MGMRTFTDTEMLTFQEAGYVLQPIGNVKPGDVVIIPEELYIHDHEDNSDRVLFMMLVTSVNGRDDSDWIEGEWVEHRVMNFIGHCDDGVIRDFSYGCDWDFYIASEGEKMHSMLAPAGFHVEVEG